MTRYIAFLRAINVGGHTVKMDALRSIFQAMDFENVETYIASGNVIFESSARSTQRLEEKIAAKLHNELGYEVATFVRTTEELGAIADYQPFKGADEDAGLYIAFIAEKPGKKVHDALMAFSNETDEFHIHNREVYWLCHTRFSDSTFSGKLLEKTLGMPATVRNSTTVKKMAAKYSKE